MSQISSATLPVVSLTNGKPTTTSLNVAEVFKKRHDHVLRDIDELCTQVPENFVLPNFGESETERDTGIGKVKDRIFLLTRDGLTLLVMGYTGKRAMQFKLAYIDAFNRMEAQIQGTSESTPTGIITQAQRSELKLIVDAKLSTYPAAVQGKARAEVWARHNRHFKVAEYSHLPSVRFDESREFLLAMKVNAVAVPAPAPEQPAALPFDRAKLFMGRAKALEDLDRRFIEFAGEVRQRFADFDHEYHRINDGTYAELFRDAPTRLQGSANRVVDAIAVQSYDARTWFDEGISRMRLAFMTARSANLILTE